LALAELGRREEQVAELREVIRLEPDYSAAHSLLGSALRAIGKEEEAISAYREAIRLKPREARYHCNLASVLGQLGRYKEAIATYREALRVQPDSTQALNNLGCILCDVVGDYAAAEEAFRKAVQLEPDSARHHCNLARALSQQGKTDEAIAESREAVRLAPKDSAVLTALGNMLLHAEKIEEAIPVIREAIRLQPESALTRSCLAYALFQQGAVDEAVSEQREAIRLDPGSAYAHGFLAWCLASPSKPDSRERDIEEAILHARKAIELGANDALLVIEGHTALGVAYYRNQDLGQAANHLQKVIELVRATEQPSDTAKWDEAICCFFLAMTRWQLDQKEEARRWYHQAAAWRKEHKPDNAELLRFQAEAAEMLGIDIPEPKAAGPPTKEGTCVHLVRSRWSLQSSMRAPCAHLTD
jgi:Flp pilus assembly protein TadD